MRRTAVGIYALRLLPLSRSGRLGKGSPRVWGLGGDLDIIDVYEELDKGILV